MFKGCTEGFKRELSSSNYIRMTKTSSATATLALQNLVEKGALLRTGHQRGTRYYLNLPKNIDFSIPLEKS